MSKAKKQKNANKHRALSAQQTIPYIAMHPDGICQLPGGLYTKTLEYEDINYAVASTEDQTAIILTALCRSSFPLSTAAAGTPTATR